MPTFEEYTPEELALLDHRDRGPAILGAHWGLTALATIFLSLRLYCKRLTNRSLWWDDWILIASWFAILGTDGFTTNLVTEFKLGRHSYDLQLGNMKKYLLIRNSRATFSITSGGWAKTAFAITLLRLTTDMTKRFVWFIILFLNVTTIISAVIVWVHCVPLATGWDPSVEGVCWASEVGTRIWIVLGACSALMDFVLAALPWTFLYRMRLRKKEKFGILIAMSMGVIAGAASIAKCSKLPEFGSGDSYYEVEFYIWDVMESAVTLMAACIPALRVLFQEVKHSSQSNHQLSNVSFSFDILSRGGGVFKEVTAPWETPVGSDSAGSTWA